MSNSTVPKPCCPERISEGCYTSGTTTRFWVSFREPEGNIVVLDSVTGATVDPANVVACGGEQDKTMLTNVNANENYSISATGLKSWTVHAFAPVTLLVNQENTTMIAGETISATASEGAVLIDGVTITAGAGSARIIHTNRQ